MVWDAQLHKRLGVLYADTENMWTHVKLLVKDFPVSMDRLAWWRKTCLKCNAQLVW